MWESAYRDGARCTGKRRLILGSGRNRRRGGRGAARRACGAAAAAGGDEVCPVHDAISLQRGTDECLRPNDAFLCDVWCQLFEELDADKSGALSFDELLRGLGQLGVQPNPDLVLHACLPPFPCKRPRGPPERLPRLTGACGPGAGSAAVQWAGGRRFHELGAVYGSSDVVFLGMLWPCAGP